MPRKTLEELYGNTRVLAVWQPSSLDYNTIKNELAQKVTELGFDRFNEVNVYRNYPANPKGFQQRWHRDCGGRRQYLIVWSDVHPTDVAFLTNHLQNEYKLLEAHCGSIIIFNNKEAMHREPSSAINSSRWFARIYLKGNKCHVKTQ